MDAYALQVVGVVFNKTVYIAMTYQLEGILDIYNWSLCSNANLGVYVLQVALMR